jgi:beta-galactosidase
MNSGYESGGFGLNELDGTVTERAREAGAIARVVDRNQKLFLHARPPKAEVAIVYNPLSHFVGGRQRAAVYGGPQGEVAGIERDSWIGIHRALFPKNVALDYVHIDHMTAESLRQYKLVYFAYPLMMPEAAAKVLRAYVESGGALVAEARMGWNNERGMAADRIPGMGLWEVMGCRESEISTGDKGRTELRWTAASFPGMKPGDTIPARWYEESLAPMNPNAKVVAEFAGGRAAAIESRFGKGKTLTLGSYVSAAYFTAPSDAAARFFTGLLEWAGVALPVETMAKDLEVRYLESGADRLVFVFNHAKQPVDAPVSIRLGVSEWSAVDLVDQKPVALDRAGSVIRFQSKIASDGVQTLKFTRR